MNTLQTISLMVLIGLLNIGIWSNNDIPGVVAPQLRDEWNITTSQLGQAYSFYSFPNLVVPLAYGALMDRIGPLFGLPFFLILSQLFVAGSSLMIFLCQGNVPVFLGSRAVMGLGGEFIMLAQVAAASKWFPLSQQGVADALIMIIGTVAMACLFNIFPLITEWTSLRMAFGVSCLAAITSLLLSIGYSVFHYINMKKIISTKKTPETGIELGAPHIACIDDQSAPKSELTDFSVPATPNPVTADDNEDEIVKVVPSFRAIANDDATSWNSPGITSTPGYNESIRPSLDSSRPSMDSRYPIAGGSRMSLEGSEIPSPALLDQKLRQAKTGLAKLKDLITAMIANLRRFPLMFWMLLVCCGFNLGIVQTIIAFSTDLLTEKWGLGEESSARISSVIVTTPVFASLPLGLLIDKFGHRITGFIACSTLLATSFLLLAFLPSTTHMAVPAVCLLLPGLVFAYVPTAEGSAFSLVCPTGLLSTGMGMSYVLNMFTTTVFPLVIGSLHDKYGSYIPGLILLASAGALSFTVGVAALYVDRRAPEHGRERLQLPCANIHAAH